jgi:hypothetical protein
MGPYFVEVEEPKLPVFFERDEISNPSIGGLVED